LPLRFRIVLRAIRAQVIANPRQLLNSCLFVFELGIQHAQRIRLDPPLAIRAQRVLPLFQRRP
jgi:hypothetical protein